MTDKSIRRLKRRLFGQILLRIGLSCLGLFLLILLIDEVFNGLVAESVYRLSPVLWGILSRNRDGILFGCLICLLGVVTWFSINPIFQSMAAIVDSIDRIFHKDDSTVTLPDEYAEVERKLNFIKMESLKNEQAAREAEQRKNDLVVYLAHDLKTPLTSVIGYLNLLHDEKKISEELQDKYLLIALEKARRLESLINEFFEITRFNLQHIELERAGINLTKMLRQLADECDPLFASKGLTCLVQAEPDLSVWGDADRLARVFDNLMRNAIHYSAPDSEITISAKPDPKGVRVAFRNTGSQIPERQLQSIFQKFYRLDSARSSQTGGAGLGLAIAKEIVELHGGSIWASSNAQYTEFTLLLPAQNPILPVDTV